MGRLSFRLGKLYSGREGHQGLVPWPADGRFSTASTAVSYCIPKGIPAIRLPSGNGCVRTVELAGVADTVRNMLDRRWVWM